MLLNCKSPHGGDVYSQSVKLDFSANINPAGMPEPVKAALHRAAEHCTRYPDPYCTQLRQSISAHEHVPPESILCGNGAADLIYQYAYALPKDRPALVLTPTFSEYEQALYAAGIAVKHYPLQEKDGFRLTEDILRQDLSGYGALFLCSPNNPTGLTVPPELIDRLLPRVTRLFCDFCFLDLTDTPNRYDIPALIQEHPNLTVLRAFTKSYAMAGVRLGYALCSDTEFLYAMSEKSQCWNVSTLAQEAGIAALECGQWLAGNIRRISSERRRVTAALSSLGITVYPGEANYLLLRCEKPLHPLLLKQGILVRDCSNYPGLDSRYIRIAIRTPEENTLLLSAIKDVIS